MIDLLVPLCFRSSCQRMTPCITNFESGALVNVSEVRIGTSGWHYDSWWGPFFPTDVKKKNALGYYATQFTATELNAPFYRTPTPESVRGWVQQTPDDFRFAWKASKFITHWKRLSERSENSIALLESRLKVLGRKA